MSGIIKVFLLLAVVACISKARQNEEGHCLCQRVRNQIILKSDIKDIQIYPATIFCNKVEIVVTNGNGFRYCLNPELKTVKRIVSVIMKKTSTSKPTEVTFTTGRNTSTSTSI